MTFKSLFSILTVMSLSVGCTSQPTPAAEWACRNTAAEISCQDGDCTVASSGEFTPMELTFDTNKGLSLCAYSGCWSGQAETISTAGHYFTVTGLNLPWSDTSGAPADISATLNMNTAIATLLTDEYAHPMTCERL